VNTVNGMLKITNTNLKGGIMFFKFLQQRRRFTARRAKKILRKIEARKITFSQAYREGMVPPVITSYWMLRRVVEEGVFVS